MNIDFLPLKKMWDVAQIAKQDSDTAYFSSLMNYGEMLLKFYVAGFLSALEIDPERSKYRLEYNIVRATGVGTWVESLDEILIGPTSQLLPPVMQLPQRELINNVQKGTWQYDVTEQLENCLRILNKLDSPTPPSIQGRRWFGAFKAIRNVTSHGNPKPLVCSKLAKELEASLITFTQKGSILKLPWGYLRQNLSGSYRLTKYNSASDSLSQITSRSSKINLQLSEGIYIHNTGKVEQIWNYYPVSLVLSDPEADDFMCANGGFNNDSYEMFSYISDNRKKEKNQYISPPGSLPSSLSEGIGELDIIGKCFSNMPILKEYYVRREELENELNELILNDRDSVITLHGRGGIGKTTLAINSLRKIADKGQFDAIIWFSARDIDLLNEGPKQVQVNVLNEKDMAKEFCSLMQPSGWDEKKFDKIKYLQDNLNLSSIGKPILFVLDNFETVQNIPQLYEWIYTYIRLPNKLLITTRNRSFKGDYPVEVKGMLDKEAEELINEVALKLNISTLLSKEYINEIIQESGGHPYIIKILLGECAKEKKLLKIPRVVAEQDKVLDALFERTYRGLTAAAERVFLTLSSWKSTLPSSAIKIIFLRESMEGFDVDSALDELENISFIERLQSDFDNSEFIDVPLAASLFGRKKLQSSPLKASIESDVKILHLFGPGRKGQVREGLEPRIRTLLRSLSSRMNNGEDIKDYQFLLEHIGTFHPLYLPLIGEFYIEKKDIDKAIDSFKEFIESGAGTACQKRDSWNNLANLYLEKEDYLGTANACVEQALVECTDIETISSCSNNFNALLKRHYLTLDNDDKLVLAQKLISAFENKLDNANADDLSRLAWLCIHCKEEEKAKKYAEDGLKIDGSNNHCSKLIERFGNTNS